MSPPAVLPRSQHDGLAGLLRPVLEIIVVASYFLTFLLQPFRIPSSSMQPTLRVGDCLLMDKQGFPPEGVVGRWLLPPAGVHRGEMVVFHFPVDPSLHLVKRVVGLPGDRIRLHQGRVLINGSPLAEPYAFYSAARPYGFRDEFPSLREADPNMEPAWWIELRRTIRDGEITVPPGQYFVLGDNRNNSEDSRYWGFVPQADLVGRPLLVYFSAAPADGIGWFAWLKRGLRSVRLVQ